VDIDDLEAPADRQSTAFENSQDKIFELKVLRKTMLGMLDEALGKMTR